MVQTKFGNWSAKLVFSGALCASAILAAPVAAFDYQGTSVTLVYNFHDDEYGAPYLENFTRQLTSMSRFGFGNNMSLGLSLMYGKEQFGGEFFSENYAIGLHPSYEFDQGRIGVFAVFTRDYDNSDKYEIFGIEGSYDFGAFGVEGYLGRFPDFWDDVDVWGLAADYEINARSSVYLAIQQDNDSGDKFGYTRIGYEHDIAAFSGVPMTVFAEIGKITEGEGLDSDWNQFSVGFTTYFGNKADRSRFNNVYSTEYFYV